MEISLQRGDVNYVTGIYVDISKYSDKLHFRAFEMLDYYKKE